MTLRQMAVMRRLVATLLVVLVGCTASPSPSATDATTTTLPSTTSEATVSESTTTSVVTTTTTRAPSLPEPGSWHVLFVGNSHTTTHDIPATVRSLLESIPGSTVEVATFRASSLRTGSDVAEIKEAIASGAWNVVVLQGQEVIQSHSIDYSREGAIALAQLAAQAGGRPLLFSEWRRAFIHETAYIEGIYDEIAASSGAEVIPVGRAWDRHLESQPDADLWSSDGNHSAPDGAFLAAATIAYFIAGTDAHFDTDSALQGLLDAARATVEDCLGA